MFGDERKGRFSHGEMLQQARFDPIFHSINQSPCPQHSAEGKWRQEWGPVLSAPENEMSMSSRLWGEKVHHCGRNFFNPFDDQPARKARGENGGEKETKKENER